MAPHADPFEGHEDPDPSGMLTVAILHKTLFDCYLKVGFHRAEAVQLTGAFITAAAIDKLAPDD